MGGPGEKEPLFLASFFFLPSSRSRYRTNSKHARTYATHTHAIHVESVTEYTGERRTRLASVDRGALDQQPSRGSGIAATKRERTRPLVFIRVPHYRLARLSLSFAAHPPPSHDERVYKRIHTRSGEILIPVSGPEETCISRPPVYRILWSKSDSTQPFFKNFIKPSESVV